MNSLTDILKEKAQTVVNEKIYNCKNDPVFTEEIIELIIKKCHEDAARGCFSHCSAFEFSLYGKSGTTIDKLMVNHKIGVLQIKDLAVSVLEQDYGLKVSGSLLDESVFFSIEWC